MAMHKDIKRLALHPRISAISPCAVAPGARAPAIAALFAVLVPLTASPTNAQSCFTNVANMVTVTCPSSGPYQLGTFTNKGNFWNGQAGSSTPNSVNGAAGSSGNLLVRPSVTFTNAGIVYNGGGGGASMMGSTATGGAGGNGTMTLDRLSAFANTSNFFNGGYGGFTLSSGSGGAGGVGALTLNSAATLTNNDSFANGGHGGNTDDRGIGGNGGLGIVILNPLATFINNTEFLNGGVGGRSRGSGDGGAGGDGRLTIQASATFINAGHFVNGGSIGASTSTGSGGAGGKGLVTIDAGGFFTNTETGAFGNLGTVNNAGTFTNNGTISGTGTFNNLAGGIFNTGGTMSFATFSNAGAVVIAGGTGPIATHTMTGTYIQTSTGSLNVRADWTGNGGAGAADRLNITGTAALAGTVAVTPVNFPSTAGLTRTFTLLTASNGITNNGITIANTAAVDYALLYPNANTMDVKATINFQAPSGNLTGNQSSVGGALNTIFSGGTRLPFMTSLMQLPGSAQLGVALDQLAPHSDGAANTATMKTGATFANHLLSCRVAGEDDAYAVIREGQCLWARASVRKANGEITTDNPGWRETANFVSAGMQIDIGGPWRIGAGIGYETTTINVSSGGRSEGERLHLGGLVKYNPGPWLLAASINGGLGWTDNVRTVDLGGFNAVAQSSSETSFVTGRLTGAYLWNLGAVYLKPQADLSYTWLHRDGYRETGTGGIALDVASSDDHVWAFSPSVELGTELPLIGIGILRPYVKGGATIRDKDTFATTASFVEAQGAAPFAITSKVDRVTADVAVGVDLITAGDTALRLQYDNQTGEHTTQHVGTAKVSLKF